MANITEAQRQAMREVRIDQALSYLDAISDRRGGLINGNFTATAHKFGLKVRELRERYDTQFTRSKAL